MKIYRNLRIVLRGIRLAKKIAATLAGFVLSVILFLGTKSLVLDYIMGGDGRDQHEVFKIICLVIMPFAIFIIKPPIFIKPNGKLTSSLR